MLALFSLSALPLAAQFDTGTISGSITDPSGAVVPNASVTVTNTGTSLTKTVRTDGSGHFVASALPFGNYQVSATASGFNEAKSQPIVLQVGAIVRVTLALSVSGAQQVVDVTGTPNTVQTESSTSGTTLNSTQISNLPVNGRDAGSFLNIAPGSVGSTGYFQGSVNGLDNIFTGLNVTVDGQNATRGDLNGALYTEGQEQAHITRSSIDSIQEIDYANSGYSAEMGHSLGPQMNIITKAGTNQIHGTLFEFLRNDALDARDYFETGPKQPLKLNQFGGNLSGPIVREKLFFFINYEGDRQHITTLLPANETLSAYARSLFVPSMQPVLAQFAPLPAGCTAIPAPASCAVPGSDSGTAGGANLVYDPAALPTTLREDTGSARIDYNLSEADRLMFRYNISDSLTDYTYGPNQGQTSPQKLRTQLGKFDYTHTFSPTLLNQFSVGIDRFYSDTNSNTPTPLAGFSGFFTNLGSLPGPNTFNQINPNTIFEVFDNVTKVAGNHELKFGTQIRANRLNTWLRPQLTYSYASFSDLENNNPFVLQKIGFPSFLGIRDSNWDFYFQDNWKLAHTLTLNVGLRYDYNTVWSEGHGRLQNFDPATQTFSPEGQAAYNAPKNDFAPRLGLSWDPFGKGQTVFHAYAGMFYMPMHFGFGLTTNVPEFSNYNVNVFDALFGGYSIAYPAALPPLPPGTQNVTIFPRDPKDPVSGNWLFGVQQQLPWQTVLTVNYTGNKTSHLQAGVDFAAVNLNPANAATGVRQVYSNFASENVDSDTLFSKYNALQVQVRRNVSRVNLEANYTWSHESDDTVNVFSGYSNPFNPLADYGTGDIDVRHNFTASLVYSLPMLEGTNRLVHGILGGWETSSIVQARSGLPTNITLVSGFFGNPTRPDFVSGQPLYVANREWPTTSFNPAAFSIPSGYYGTWGPNWGDVPRNALRGPAFFQWDLSLMKNFPVTERAKLQFRADVFNILNHPNFANPDGGICLSVNPATATTPASCTNPFFGTSTINPNFGRSTQTVAGVSGGLIGNGTARQAQLALKLTF